MRSGIRFCVFIENKLMEWLCFSGGWFRAGALLRLLWLTPLSNHPHFTQRAPASWSHGSALGAPCSPQQVRLSLHAFWLVTRCDRSAGQRTSIKSIKKQKTQGPYSHGAMKDLQLQEKRTVTFLTLICHLKQKPKQIKKQAFFFFLSRRQGFFFSVLCFRMIQLFLFCSATLKRTASGQSRSGTYHC